MGIRYTRPIMIILRIIIIIVTYIKKIHQVAKIITTTIQVVPGTRTKPGARRRFSLEDEKQ
ncbi:MAG: hypothetical protein ACJ712_05425, partial [Nitrososphaeraceae archaeon]